MIIRHPLFAAISGLFLATVCQAEIKVDMDRSEAGSEFKFTTAPTPAANDAGATARFTLIDGARDTNGGELQVLHDGRLPLEEDQPSENFFFRAGADGGRIQIDLGRVISVKQVGAYSWHVGTRAPQVYTLYGSSGDGAQFKLGPKRGVDPATCGWKTLAQVDTRPLGNGGQHGVAITDSSGALGKFRYLLFDVARTENRDPFGNTFYSEIDVIDADGPPLVAIASEEPTPIVKSFEAADGKFHFTIDVTKAPDLAEWSENELKPVVQEWYPKIVAMLPSDGFEAPTKVTLRFRNDMGGTPASAGGASVNLNVRWFRGELEREALGAVVHELVHVVQSYNQGRRGNARASRPPGWLVEGIPDYIRWFLYEPQTGGADITNRNFARARYDASYRITGNFLNWVILNHGQEIVRTLNAALREGRYNENFWKDATGKSVQELGDDWKKFHEQRLNGAKS
jgi:hypothetical protein